MQLFSPTAQKEKKKKNSFPTQTKEQKRFTVNFSQKILERKKISGLSTTIPKRKNPSFPYTHTGKKKKKQIIAIHHQIFKETIDRNPIGYIQYIQSPRRDSTEIVRFVALEYNAESRGVQLMECGIHIPRCCYVIVDR